MSKQLIGYKAKDIEGYEGRYSVTECGKVYSHSRVDTNGQLHKGRWLKPYEGGKYTSLRLSKDGIVRTVNVHSLVADAFIPNPDGLYAVNHKDEDKHNPELSNLERCTTQYNAEYSLGVTCSFVSPEGYKVTVHNLAAFCRTEGLDPSNISKIRTGKLKHHKGWKLF